jgi:uncharacterized protein (DUF4415 family)
MNEEHITRRTLAERRRGKTDWGRLRQMSDEEIQANAAGDADNPPWTEADLAAAELVIPGDEPKVPVSIRLDPEVVDYFKREGRGYQTRISAVLRAYVRRQELRRR